MAEGLTFAVTSEPARARALDFVARARIPLVITAKPELRSIPQNDLMWAKLGELARARPDGRHLPPHKWKALAMDAAGHKPEWDRSLDGQSMVCVGYKSSRLTKADFSDLIEVINAYAAEHQVELAA